MRYTRSSAGSRGDQAGVVPAACGAHEERGRRFASRDHRYRDGGHYGTHVDSALMRHPGRDLTIRSDLSATLFLSEPADYDGGELVVGGSPGVKLRPGDLFLYPSTSLHSVTPVTRGVRVASFFWVQSMVRAQSDRDLLLDLDRAIQALAVTVCQNHPEIVRLTGVYHNLLRRCAEL